MAWTNTPLTAEAVFTCIALFNVLIAPLNALPWVINCTVEAIVSARRLSTFLADDSLNYQGSVRAADSVFDIYIFRLMYKVRSLPGR